MRCTIYFISLLCLMAATLGIMPAQAQDKEQHALYNYRNDGSFNAWLNNDIDSITYSRIDTLGIEHDDIVVQEVWTPDSLYRIPLEAIDSIGFRAPEPVMRDGIFFLRNYHAAHTVAIDSLTLYFDSSIHRDSLPDIGQVVLHGVYTTPYEEGFAGKVTDIRNENGYVVVDCEMLCVADVYKRLVMAGSVITESAASRKAKQRRVDEDPWKKFEDSDLIIKDIGDITLKVLDGLFFVNSIKPTLSVSYSVYVDEAIYDMAATIRLTHNNLEYGIDLNLNKLKDIEEDESTDKEWKSVAQALQRMQNYKNMSQEDWVKSVVEETKQKGSKEIVDEDQACLMKILWDKLHKSWTIPIGGPFVLDIEVGPLLDLKGSIDIIGKLKTKGRNTIFVHAKGSTIHTLANVPIAMKRGLAEINGYSKFDIEPAHSLSLGIMAKGSLDVGIMGKASLSLIHKGVIHATGSFKGGLKLAGDIGFEWDSESAYSEDFSLYNALYDGVKNTKVKLEAFACVGLELGITPWKFLTVGAEWEVGQEELGSCYLFPHFSKPSFPTYDSSENQWSNGNSNNHVVLQSLPTKNIPDFLLGPCKVGLKIFDKNGNPVTETQEREYRDDNTLVWQLFPLEIDLKDLTPGNTYRCYPVLRYQDWWQLGASPSYEFTIPQPMSVSPGKVKLSVGDSRIVEIVDGWDTFAVVISGDEEVASIVNDGTTDARHIKVVGKKAGISELQIEDRRSGDIIKVPITVKDDHIGENTISVTPQQIDFGEVDINSYSEDRYVIITNNSGQDQTITMEIDNSRLFRLQLGGPNGGGREKDSFTQTIHPDDQILLKVIFRTPSDVGEYHCILTVSSEEAEGWECVIPIKAKCVEVQEDPSFHLSAYSIDVYVKDDKIVEIHNGSGDYEIINDYPDIVESDINIAHVAHVPPKRDPEEHEQDIPYDMWNITGKKVGHAVLKLRDNKTNEMLTLNVEVKQAPHLTLSAQYVELSEGETDSSIEIKAGSGWYELSSEDAEIATARKYYNSVSWVDENGVAHGGTFLEIKGLKAGSTKVTVKDMSSEETAVIQVKVTGDEIISYLTCPDDQHPHLIDLGLPSGTKWACCNVDSDPTKQSPSNYGGYFAWGETEEKDYYDWSTYIHCDGTSSSCNYFGNISGTAHDVAHVKWGSGWQMPTIDQVREILDNCTYTWTTENGVKGGRFTSKKYNSSIFMPASGYIKDDHLYVKNNEGFYWTGTQYPEYNYGAYDQWFESLKANWHGPWSSLGRCCGFPIRPVMNPNGKTNNDVGGSLSSGGVTSGGSDSTHNEYDDF